MADHRTYNDPAGGTPSEISANQFSEFWYQKQALIEARKEQYFTQLADVVSMPKHMGKTIKRYHYIPLLDVENQNDQGLDAAGAVIDSTKSTVTFGKLVNTFVVEADATAVAAAVNAAEGSFAAKTGSSTPWTVTLDALTLTAPVANALANSIVALASTEFGVTAVRGSGNLYGSSKDIGTIPGKLPVLGENGGRVNRVGFKRKELEGTFEKFGFFDEYSADSVQFDSDAELMSHINREMVNGAVEMSEDALQIDLINAAGVIRYAGSAIATSGVAATDIVTYADLMRLAIDLDNNRTPKHTKVITGTRNIDTKTIPACRVMYIGSELQPLFEAMVDLHDERAFIPVQKYAAGGTTLTGEWGTCGPFRLVVVPEMMKWEGAGAAATGAQQGTHYTTRGRVDVFPMLVVGDESFTTIGFQTDGKSTKFKIIHKKPGEAMVDLNDPFGELGFMSIKWWYGFMTLRSERIALVKTAATL